MSVDIVILFHCFPLLREISAKFQSLAIQLSIAIFKDMVKYGDIIYHIVTVFPFMLMKFGTKKGIKQLTESLMVTSWKIIIPSYYLLNRT